jgi:cardiolipin synthase
MRAGRLVQAVPNLITFARLLAVPVFVWLVLDGALAWAFWLFVAAGASDALDGLLARAFRVRSTLGAWLDPVADKALLVSAFLALAGAGLLPNWVVVLVVSRDIMIVGGVLLMYTMRLPVAMEPSLVSKANTLMQIVLAASVLGVHGLSLGTAEPWLTPLVWAVGATTLASGAVYVARGWRLFAAQPPSA